MERGLINEYVTEPLEQNTGAGDGFSAFLPAREGPEGVEFDVAGALDDQFLSKNLLSPHPPNSSPKDFSKFMKGQLRGEKTQNHKKTTKTGAKVGVGSGGTNACLYSGTARVWA